MNNYFKKNLMMISVGILAGMLPGIKLKAETKFLAPKILARANVKDTYNLPPMTFLSNLAPVINNRGEVAFKVVATTDEGAQALWVKSHLDENGKIQYIAPSEYVVTDPSINDLGLIAFSLFDDVGSEGLFTLDSDSLKVNHVYDGRKGAITFFTYPTINNKNEIYFRGTDKFNNRRFYRFDKTLNPLVEEGVEISGNTASYIFKPSINQNGLMAFKMRLGKKGEWDETNPDLIALYSPTNDREIDENGKDLGLKAGVRTIAADRDLDHSSKYASFLNSLSLSNANHIGFAAVTEDGRIEVKLSMPDGSMKHIALENEGDVLNVETFSVKVNKLGHLLFRGKNKANKRCLFFYDGEKLTKIIGEGDEVETDKGPAKILDNQHYPGFSGEVDLNDQDQIVFGAVLETLDNHDLGQAVFLLNTQK